MPDLLERLKITLADRYAVESEIGRGGMATVFLAEDLRHGRQVAIKVLHPELAACLGTDRFLREIGIVSRLDHPHILPLYDSGKADALLFYVMPYVEGESLRQRLESEGQLPIEQALSIAAEVADALAYAHRQGVIHRDIKPGNILLAEGHARIADFGVARAVGAASEGDATATGLAVGTPKYMSPEQAVGGDVDGRSDVYALGCVLYEMLAGDPPFDGPTPQVILSRKSSETVPGLRVRRKTVPADLEGVIAKAMATAPIDRFPTAEEFAEALKAPERVGRFRLRRRVLHSVVGAVTALVALVAAIWLARFFADGTGRLGTPAVEPNPDAIAVMPFYYSGPSEDLKRLALEFPALFMVGVTGEYGPYAVSGGKVVEMWVAGGGAVGTLFPQERALQIAAVAGAGGLVEGVVAGTEEDMTLMATLVEVPTGRERVGRIKVEGSYEEWQALVESLINQLLATDYGSWTAADLPVLSKHDPDAVQAYLRGDMHEALVEDSTFYFAAYIIYRNGERDQEAARYLWQHLNEMRPIDRMETLALTGWRFGATRTLVERFAQYDSATNMAGAEEFLSDIVSLLYQRGSLVDFPGYLERARASRLRWRELGQADPKSLGALYEIARAEGDTAAMFEYAEEIDPLATSAADSVASAAVRLHAALLQDDDDVVERLWAEVDAAADSALCCLDPLHILLIYGKGLDGLDRFFLSGEGEYPTDRMLASGSGLTWARARGRHQDWRVIRGDRYERLNRLNPLSGSVLRMRDALFLGEPEDSAVLAAAAFLESVAAGTIQVDPPRNDPEPETRIPALARCWSTLWNVAHGDIAAAAEVVRYLREDLPLPYRYSVCAGLIEVLMAEQEGGDLRSAVARLDSIVRPVPLEVGSWFLTRDGTHWVDNLFLAQRLVEVGDTARALAAARRPRPWNSGQAEFTSGIFIDLLREEARLAAMVGDTAGASEAYEHWLALRDSRPDGPRWAAQWDSVRAEYTAFTGVESP